jgi:two-component system chemotaxis response regulator CheY
MRFLVIDDSSVDRHLLSALIEEMGHQVDSCPSTDGALERIALGNYASVFLDIVMPDRDGFTFLRQLRANQATARQHVVLYSTKGTALEIEYGLQRAGANDYLVKPATRVRLAQILRKV